MARKSKLRGRRGEGKLDPRGKSRHMSEQSKNSQNCECKEDEECEFVTGNCTIESESKSESDYGKLRTLKWKLYTNDRLFIVGGPTGEGNCNTNNSASKPQVKFEK